MKVNLVRFDFTLREQEKLISLQQVNYDFTKEGGQEKKKKEQSRWASLCISIFEDLWSKQFSLARKNHVEYVAVLRKRKKKGRGQTGFEANIRKLDGGFDGYVNLFSQLHMPIIQRPRRARALGPLSSRFIPDREAGWFSKFRPFLRIGISEGGAANKQITMRFEGKERPIDPLSYCSSCE